MITEELRWFLAVAETEHVTDAAALVGTTQPTLSRAIVRLERHLGTQLFDRDRNRLRLNQAGRVYRRHAQRALDELESAQDRIAALLPAPAEPLRLACAHSLGSWLLPELLTAYRDHAPGHAVDVREGSAAAVLDLLAVGAVDLALTGPQPSPPGYGWLPLAEERLVLAVPAGHRLAGRAGVGVSELTDGGFVIMRQDVGLREVTCGVFHRSGVTASVAAEADTVAGILDLVAARRGAALVPAGAVAGHPGIETVPLTAADAHRTVGLAWRRGRPLPAPARAFRVLAGRGRRAPRPAGPAGQRGAGSAVQLARRRRASAVGEPGSTL
ncbi:LysR family transcriptional regulator [Streptomyces sp. SP17BM10]|uniref:LysR family transcriptional regulator n=1 Tax=Streptomyces sp. SP17BM10 TaxID=3002530 RepID=UPI002E786479|nr:LysR family transcriptional regulator [Streptomyces sp. SP17BM10]MEE1784473.1 LysR family transcriptional regulator [Streptomyces sp. SP17BM10]